MEGKPHQLANLTGTKEAYYPNKDKGNAINKNIKAGIQQDFDGIYFLKP